MFATYERRRKWLPRRHHASLCMWRARAHAVKPFREMLVEYRFVINIMSNHAICGSLRRGNRRFPNLVRSETVVWAASIPLGKHWYEGFPPRAGPCCLVEERNSLTFPRFWWIWYREMELILFSNVMSTLKINFSNLFSVNKASILWPIVLELQQSKDSSRNSMIFWDSMDSGILAWIVPGILSGIPTEILPAISSRLLHGIVQNTSTDTSSDFSRYFFNKLLSRIIQKMPMMFL